MSADPVGQPLAPAGLGVGVVGGAQHRDEDLGAPLLAGRGVEHRHRVAGIVDEQLLAGSMRLAHRRRDGLAPFPIEVAEAAVAVAVGVLGRGTPPTAAAASRRAAAAPRGRGSSPAAAAPASASNDAGVNSRRSSAASSISSGTGQVMPTTPARRRYSPTVERLTPSDDRDQPLARAAGVPQSQNFSDLPHRHSLGGHRASLASAQRRPRAAIRSPTARASGPPSTGWPASIGMGGRFRRNGWPACVGISGRFGSDYADWRQLKSDAIQPKKSSVCNWERRSGRTSTRFASGAERALRRSHHVVNLRVFLEGAGTLGDRRPYQLLRRTPPENEPCADG